MADAAPPAEFEQLIEFIKRERAFDFTGYKRPSLMRRVRKRMEAIDVESFAQYHRHLEENPEEFVELFNTILINVTSFYRDAPAWTFLTEEIVPRLLASGDEKDPIRVWSTGCATGEEAYTIAIIMAEALGDEAFKRRVKIYATDVDEEALNLGRHGVYTSRALANVPEELREKYFERLDSRFAFKKAFRRSVVFGRHDLIQDPPISRVGLLVSRNTLMYFDAETQRRILMNFHFSLTDDGFLFLGKSEVLVTRTKLFTPVDLRHRMFAKIPRADVRERLPVVAAARAATDVEPPMLLDAAFDTVPIAQIVIDREGRLTMANAHARTLFGLTSADVGRPIQDLEVSYRPLELRSRIDDVYARHHGVTARGVELPELQPARVVDVHISPLVSRDGAPVGVAVTFTDASRTRQLEQELDVVRKEMETTGEELQSTVEELETTNEELQSTNEELETTNEELQSTNEELETMNEELQSTNEELESMNDELRQRTDELDESNSFLESILESLAGAVIVVDGALNVQAWNEQAQELWGLRSDEVVGQHLMNLDIGLSLTALHTPLRDAIAGKQPASFEVNATNRRGRPVACTISFAPLRSLAGDVRGAIVFMTAAEPSAA